MKKYLIFFAICWIIFLTHAILLRHAIYGDGGGYYAYTQAIFFDKGLNFGPVNNYFIHFQGVKYEFSRLIYVGNQNPFLIGTGLIWIPSVAFLSIFFHNRFDLIFEIGPGLTGILLVLGGLYFVEKYLQKFFSKTVSSWTIVFVFLASNLFYYSSFEPALSHQPSFFIISFLLYKSYKMKLSLKNYFLVGALSGLLFITRITDIILLIPILYQLFQSKPKIQHIATYLLSAVIFTIPLWWSLKIMYGNAFLIPYFMAPGMRMWSFSIKSIFTFLFTAKRGLFTWTPIYFAAIIGLIKSRKYEFIIAATLLIFICAFWAPVSVAFGQRYVLGGIPFFAFGIAKLIEKINHKWVWALFTPLFVWNMLTIFQFYANKADLIKNDNLTLDMFIKGQFTAPFKALETVSNKGLNYFIYKKVLY